MPLLPLTLPLHLLRYRDGRHRRSPPRRSFCCRTATASGVGTARSWGCAAAVSCCTSASTRKTFVSVSARIEHFFVLPRAIQRYRFSLFWPDLFPVPPRRIMACPKVIRMAPDGARGCPILRYCVFPAAERAGQAVTHVIFFCFSTSS